MNKEVISQLYSKLLNFDNGMKQIKFDLHIHSPASDDFNPASDMIEEQAYFSLLNEALDNDIQIIAITDHNTFDGYNKIRDLIKSQNKYKNLLVLCGIEITCFSKHILAIFNNDFSTDRQKNFLNEIGIETTEGTDLITPIKLVEKIKEYNGFSILAHADENNGFLQHLCKNKTNNEFNFSGKSVIKILSSESLLGIQVNNEYTQSHLKGVFANPDYQKARRLPFLKFSDAHGVFSNGTYSGTSGKKIGEVYSVIKLSELTFQAVKTALLDAEIRVLNNIFVPDYPYIFGTAIKNSFLKQHDDDLDYNLIRLHSGLNCLIGGRGTGKSTFLKILMHILNLKDTISNDDIEDIPPFDEAVIFIIYKNDLYALYWKQDFFYNDYTEERSSDALKNLKIYKRISPSSKKFSSTNQNSAFEILEYISTSYAQGELSDFRKNNFNKIVDEFLKWKKKDKFANSIKSINHGYNEIDRIFSHDIFQETATDRIIEILIQHDLLNEIIKKQKIILDNIEKKHDLYKEMINEINDLTKGKLKLKLTIDFSDHYDYLTSCNGNSLPWRIGNLNNKNFEYITKASRLLKQVITVSKTTTRFYFFKLILEKNFSYIIKNYNLSENYNVNLSEEEIEDILGSIHQLINKDIITIFPKFKVSMEYNVAYKLSANEKYLDSKKISLGQNAVALLDLILNVANTFGDTRTLLIDQPEDDIDNNFIYNTLVKELRKTKSKRQIVISTHNPNIPVAADAENILVLQSNGENGFVTNVGSLDTKEIANAIVNTLEGGDAAIKQRYTKYQTMNIL